MGSTTGRGRGPWLPVKKVRGAVIHLPTNFRENSVMYTINVQCFSLKKQWNACIVVYIVYTMLFRTGYCSIHVNFILTNTHLHDFLSLVAQYTGNIGKKYSIAFAKSYRAIWQLEMANLGPARGPKRADTGRAGPENPGPRALRDETGLMIFYLRFLCSLCAGRLVVTRELCIVVTCKCVVY